jgi:hypothetical protein
MKKAICFVLTLFILVTLLFTPVASSGYVGETETVQYSTKIGYITSKYTVIETKYITFEIPEGVYIPYNLEKYADSMYLAMEKVSGLSFINSFNSTRPVVRVMFGPAYADGMIAVCRPDDLFLGKSYAILHELSHVLHHSQPYDGYATKGPGAILTEGFAEYTSYLTLKYLAENDPETYYAIEPIQNVINFRGTQPFPYEKDIQYWIKNGFDNSSMHYKVGLYLMAYLDNTYGNYTAWISEVEKMPISPFLANISPNDQIKAIANAYGTNALDGFYKWVKNNGTLFAYDDNLYLDMTKLIRYRIFPEYVISDIKIRLSIRDYNNYTVAYNGLTIELDALRHYLEEYKGLPADNLVLHSDAKMIYAHYTNGKTIVKFPWKGEIILDGVSSLTLVGYGELTEFEITDIGQ